MDKTKLGIIEHLRCPVDDWTVRKHFEKFSLDDGGLCRVLKVRIIVFIIIVFIVRVFILVLMICFGKKLEVFNCCQYSR
jgi:hypothetical protein